MLVEVERGHAGEVETLLFVALHQLGVQALGRGARGEAEDATGLFGNELGDDVGRSLAHILVIFGYDDFH